MNNNEKINEEALEDILEYLDQSLQEIQDAYSDIDAEKEQNNG